MVRLEDLSDISIEDDYHDDDDDHDNHDDGSLSPSKLFPHIFGVSITLPSHEHSLGRFFTGNSHCDGCPEQKSDGLDGYKCRTCDFTVHKECAESSLEIHHPSHNKHPLKLLIHGLSGTDNTCRFCGEKLRKLVYHCSICNFSLDPFCARNLLELTVHYPKGHEHILTLMPRLVKFTCNACGLESDRSPYVCPQCDFMVHSSCIYLPRVINIMRHKHRISKTYFLGPGNWICGVCRKKIDGRYGAYSCSVCLNYAVHSKCATRKDVWDGKELEDEPEEYEECDEPYRVVSDKVINHFSHQIHDLRLEDGITNIGNENMCCIACVGPIYSESYYICMHCDDFILHETCANLPRKQRHVLHNHPLTLYYDEDDKTLDESQGVFICFACRRFYSGFRYSCCDINLDVRCGSLSEPFNFECHPHPLFQTSSQLMMCVTCKQVSQHILNCMDCDFSLDFKCAVLPNMVKYKYDEHPLTLCYDGDKDLMDSYWCEICENEMDREVIFYTRKDYGLTIHINCVLGEFRYVRPKRYIEINGNNWEVALNGINRPMCSKCGFRCEEPFVAVKLELLKRYACSLSCLLLY